MTDHSTEMDLAVAMDAAARENDLDEAIEIIMEAIGQKTGDVAGQFFSDFDRTSMWIDQPYCKRYETLQRYIDMENLYACSDAAMPLEASPQSTFFVLVDKAIIEAEKAMKKYPQPNYIISKFAEESGEVVKAAIHCAEGREEPDHVVDEMTQAIAMLYRLWVEGDQVHGLIPLGE